MRFTQLSKYAHSITTDCRTKMSKFVSRVSNMIFKECFTTMLVHDMYISRLMVHAQQIEEKNLKEISREELMDIMDDENLVHARFGRWVRCRFRQRYSGQGSTKAPPKPRNERVSNSKPQGDNCKSLISTCAKCGRNHEGKCLEGSNGCFGCGKMDHKIRDWLSIANNNRDSHHRAQPYPSSGPGGSSGNASKQKYFDSLQTRGDQESFPTVMTGMLKVFHIDVHVLSYPGTTLSFVTPFVSM